MAVYIYKGDYKIVAKSGVGKAIEHQEEALDAVGYPMVDSFKEPCQIVHINTVFPSSLFAALWAKWKKRKVIYYGHSTMEDFRNSFAFSNMLAPLFKWWICRLYSLGDCIITPSEYSKKLLLSYHLKKPIFALSNGVETDFFSYSDEAKKRFREKFHIREEEKIVISAGHFIDRKGIVEFLEIAKSMPEVKFIWFGHTSSSLLPQNILHALENKSDNVIFPGFVSREELRDAYCGADCFLFLSKEETEGIVVLEALSCEIPTVLMDIPVYDPWIENKVHAYKAKNIWQAKESVEEALAKGDNPFAEEARALAMSRSIQKVGEGLVKIYHEILQ